MMLQNVLANLLSKPATRPFPKEKRAPAAGYRGAVEFQTANCVYCGACALRCPANAIEVDRAIQRLAFDPFRCVGCACCAEACKRGCVQLLPTYARPSCERPGFEVQQRRTRPADEAPAAGPPAAAR